MPDCKHPAIELGYREWHADADRRAKRGEKQLMCPACGKWIWRSLYYDTSGCWTEARFKKEVKDMEDAMKPRKKARKPHA